MSSDLLRSAWTILNIWSYDWRSEQGQGSMGVRRLTFVVRDQRRYSVEWSKRRPYPARHHRPVEDKKHPPKKAVPTWPTTEQGWQLKIEPADSAKKKPAADDGKISDGPVNKPCRGVNARKAGGANPKGSLGKPVKDWGAVKEAWAPWPNQSSSGGGGGGNAWKICTWAMGSHRTDFWGRDYFCLGGCHTQNRVSLGTWSGTSYPVQIMHHGGAVCLG